MSQKLNGKHVESPYIFRLCHKNEKLVALQEKWNSKSKPSGCHSNEKFMIRLDATQSSEWKQTIGNNGNYMSAE